MKLCITFWLTLVVSGFNLSEAYSTCDPNIIAQIKTIWGDHVPSRLIEQAQDNGKELVIITTEHYYPKGLKCVYSDFKNDEFFMTLVPKKGVPNTMSFTIEEDGGKTVSHTEGQIIDRYHVYKSNGVTGIYACNRKGGDVDSKPDGFVKVKAGNIDEQSVKDAIKALNSIGVELREKYCKEERGSKSGSGSVEDPDSDESDSDSSED